MNRPSRFIGRRRFVKTVGAAVVLPNIVASKALGAALIACAVGFCSLALYAEESEARQGEGIRIAFMTDMQFDGPPKNGHRFGLAEQGNHNTGEGYNIALFAWQAMTQIKPDYIFDAGDLTSDSADEEYLVYRDWMVAMPAPVYPVMGNHDRQHTFYRPYGRGFFSILGQGSATRTLKAGNLVFILISQDHIPQSGVDSISTQKLQWIRGQLEKHSKGDNNIFLITHHPLNNTTAFSDKWWRTNHPAWKRTSKELKEMLTEYEKNVVAMISGHVHMQWDFKDTPDDKWDGEGETENVGFFVDGREISSQKREYEPRHLPEVYFLNLQALDWPHGRGREATVYYADARPGSRELELLTMRTEDKKVVDRYKIRLPHAVDVGDRKMRFQESDLEIYGKDLAVQIDEDDWFVIPKGNKGTVIFQQEWAEPVEIRGVTVEAEGGTHGNVLYKTSDDPLGDWPDYDSKPPEEAGLLRLQIDFEADPGSVMRVHDVRIDVQ